MRIRVAVLVWLLLGHVSVYAADSLPDWDSLVSRSLYMQFLDKNEDRIVNLKNVAEIRGLELSDASPTVLSTFGLELTNVVSLKVTSSATNLPVAFFSAITDFSRLEYLHLQCRQARAVPPHVTLLTNLLHLRYLAIVAPAATRIDRGIYQIESLEELFLAVGGVNLPDGIARLPKLARLEIWGKPSNPVRSLPADLPKSGIRVLVIANVPGVETLLPTLPPDLVELCVLRCQLRSIPNAWLENQKLQVIDLNLNKLAHFPTELLSIQSLKLISLELNNITNVPALEIPDTRPLKISLIANPIQHFAAENEPLVQRGVIEK